MKKQYLPWNLCTPITAKSNIMVGNLNGNNSYRSYRRRGMGPMWKNVFWKEFHEKRLANDK